MRSSDDVAIMLIITERLPIIPPGEFFFIWDNFNNIIADNGNFLITD